MSVNSDRDTQHPRPLNQAFYEDLRAEFDVSSVVEVRDFEEPGAFVIEAKAGEVLSLQLLDGPQVINLFAYNTHDPDERLWAQETLLIEGMFLSRYSRLWGTMARFRPLLTVIEDTVTSRVQPGQIGAKHHIIHGGAGTPAQWRRDGGHAGVLTTWEQFKLSFEFANLPVTLLKDNASFFQKALIDSYTQRLKLLPSDAIAGDYVAMFAELDVTILLALSPYVDGAQPAELLAASPVKPIRVATHPVLAEPLGWPYEGMGYPDLSLYLGEDGMRTNDPSATRGLESPV